MHLVAESWVMRELILRMSTNEEKLRFWNRGRWHFAVEWRGKLEASHAYKIRPIFNPIKPDFQIFVFVFVSFSIQSKLIDEIKIIFHRGKILSNGILSWFYLTMQWLCKQPIWILFSSSSSSILEEEEPIFGRLGVGGSPQFLLSWGQFYCKQMICAGALSPFLGQLYLWQCFNSLWSQNLHFGCFCTAVSSQAADLIKSTLFFVPLPMLPTLKQESCLGSIPGCPAETNMSARLPSPSRLYFIIVLRIGQTLSKSRKFAI